MVQADFRGKPTYVAVFEMMISSKNVNQNMLKIPYFLKNFVKIHEALEVPPPDPRWPLADGGSAPRTPPPCDLTQTYCTVTKRFKFIALFNEGFKKTILVKTFFGGQFRKILPTAKLFCSPTAMIQPQLLAKIFLVKFGQVWLDLCEIKVKFGKI